MKRLALVFGLVLAGTARAQPLAGYFLDVGQGDRDTHSFPRRKNRLALKLGPKKGILDILKQEGVEKIYRWSLRTTIWTISAAWLPYQKV